MTTQLSYDVCKKLKDLGLPQTIEREWYCGGHIYFDEYEEGTHKECDEKEPYNRGDHYCESAMMTAEFPVMIPQIEDLLDWIGDEFVSLRRCADGSFVAVGNQETNFPPIGWTAIEALARLCIALKSHD